jgi:hypothetical protein
VRIHRFRDRSDVVQATTGWAAGPAAQARVVWAVAALRVSAAPTCEHAPARYLDRRVPWGGDAGKDSVLKRKPLAVLLQLQVAEFLLTAEDGYADLGAVRWFCADRLYAAPPPASRYGRSSALGSSLRNRGASMARPLPPTNAITRHDLSRLLAGPTPVSGSWFVAPLVSSFAQCHPTRCRDRHSSLGPRRVRRGARRTPRVPGTPRRRGPRPRRTCGHSSRSWRGSALRSTQVPPQSVKPSGFDPWTWPTRANNRPGSTPSGPAASPRTAVRRGMPADRLRARRSNRCPPLRALPSGKPHHAHSSSDRRLA